MNKIMLGIGLGAAALLTGCCANYGPVIGTGIGGIVDEKNPAIFNIDNSVKPVKCGIAGSKGIVFYSTGDNSIKAAMDNGGISKIHHVDIENFNVLGIYSRCNTIVWGE